jgi:hypothetical protein
MAKNKSTQPIADNQANNTRRQKLHPDMEPHKWKPGQSGNPNGRPLKALTQVSIDKELGDQTCPERIWKEIERQVPGCFPKDWRPPTWLQCEVVKNRIKAMSLSRGDAMAIARWQMADGRPRIQISGPEGGPIEMRTMDLKKLTVEELRLWRELAIKAAIDESEEN